MRYLTRRRLIAIAGAALFALAVVGTVLLTGRNHGDPIPGQETPGHLADTKSATDSPSPKPGDSDGGPSKSWTTILPPDSPPPAVAPFDATTAKKHQQAWADYLGVPVEFSNSIGLKMVLIPPGEFMMGSGEEEMEELLQECETRTGMLPEYVPFRGPQHKVRITKPFYIAAHETTVGQFRAFVKDEGYLTTAETDGRGSQGLVETGDEWSYEHRPEFNWKNLGAVDMTDEYPVVNVNWNDASAFCGWLSQKERSTYRLPTEAEWEYTCRAGTTTRWFFGDDEADFKAYCRNQDKRVPLHPVCQKAPNGFGMYDVYGQAWEWCLDWFSPDYYESSPVEDPDGPPDGNYRTYRGEHPEGSAFRGRFAPKWQSLFLGFRPVLVIDPKNPKPTPKLLDDSGSSVTEESHDKAPGSNVSNSLLSKEPVTVLRGHKGVIRCVSFSPDGSLLATTSEDSTVAIWDPNTGRLLRSLTGDTGEVHTVSFSADGKLLASGGEDKTVRLWNVASGKLLRSFEGHQDRIKDVAFNGRGTILASASADGTVKLWDTDTGRLRRDLDCRSTFVTSVAFSEDGRMLLSGGAGRLELWNMASGQLRDSRRISEGNVATMRLSPDGLFLAAGGGETIQLLELPSLKPRRSLLGHTHTVAQLDFSPDGSLLVSSDMDYTIGLWDVPHGNLLKTIRREDKHHTFGIAFSPDGSLLALSNSNFVDLWQVNYDAVPKSGAATTTASPATAASPKK